MQHSKNFFLVSLHIILLLSINIITNCASPDFQCVSTSTQHKTAKVFNSQNNLSESINTCSRDPSIRIFSIEFQARTLYVDTVIDIGDSVKELKIHNTQTDCIRVRVSRRHSSIEKISTDNCIYFNQVDQFLSFNYFPNLATLILRYPKFHSIPVFSAFHMLEQVDIQYAIFPSPVIFDATTFNGLSRLSQLKWEMHFTNGISFTKDCFTNLPSLTHLDIVGRIDRVHNYLFIALTELKALGLEGSHPLTIEEHSFEGLNQLTRLSFWNSQGINRDFLRTRRFPNLEGIALYNNGLTSLDHVFYQQQPALSNLVATSNDFHCDCNLQWVAMILSLTISGTCSSPSNLSGVSITNSSNYLHCNQDLSYLCFDSAFNCPPNSVCLNTKDSAYCQCNPGFSLADNMCRYVNACQINNRGCEQTCLNTTDGFHCGCRDGYRLAADLHSCLDLDECLTISADDCHDCRNTLGSYECTCNTGYMFSAASQACTDVDECDNDNSCHQLCNNTTGSYSCSCNEGFSLIGTACVDVDECQVARCEQICVNTVGSYMCACNDTYVYSHRTNSCVLVSELMMNNLATQTIVPVSILGILLLAILMTLIIVFISLSAYLCWRQRRLSRKEANHVYENNSQQKANEIDFEVGSNPLYAKIQVSSGTSTCSKRELPSLPTEKKTEFPGQNAQKT